MIKFIKQYGYIVILFLVGFYIVASTVKENKTVEAAMPAFSFINQYNEKITEQNTRGKYIISAFFFTSCPTVCPKMSAQMQRVQKAIAARKNVVILYHTINPEKDSPEVLLKYADKWGAKKGTWHFLTGNVGEINKMADFYLIRSGTGSSSELLHDGMFVLTDAAGKKIGFYKGTDSTSIHVLLKDIQKI